MTQAARCPVTGCDTLLRWSVDTLGRAVAECDGCARRDRGLCMDCPARLPVGAHRHKRKLRCPACATARRTVQKREAKRREYREYDNRQKILARNAAWRAENAERRRAQSAEYREREREATRARARERYRTDPAFAEERRAAARKQYAKNRAALREAAREKWRTNAETKNAERRAWRAEVRAMKQRERQRGTPRPTTTAAQERAA